MCRMPNMGGLFDTGIAGVTDEAVASVKYTNDASDIFDKATFNSIAGDELIDSQSLLEASLSEDFPILDGFANLDDSFMEVFTDLTELMGGDLVSSIMTTSDQVVVAPMEVSSVCEEKPLKRKRTNTDHDDYTSKPAKRRHLSSQSSIECDESEVSTSTATPISGEEKYINRRQKNNIASKRSRETRKQKFQSMEGKATELEEANAELRQRIVHLEALAKEMKDILVQKLAGK